MLHGFDVSGFQGTSVPLAHFIFIKATEGSGYTSSKFAEQWADAKHKGVLRGAYHFARPEESSAVSQADRLLNKAHVVPGEMLCLDLEASNLKQGPTNAWAKEFGDHLRAKVPGVTTVVYMGSGYASTNTGRDLSKHFDFWWYPQYPSGKLTHVWRTTFDPWLPSGITTGWSRPHIWQFTDNFLGLDASISTLTLAQLAGKPAPKPTPPPVPKPPPVPNPPAWPGTVYRYSPGHPLMHGAHEKWVQERLNAHGAKPKLTADGQYGSRTAAAVKTFQHAVHLTVDGEVGKLTWGALAK